ncbi:hypothetical protein [Fangia hongkongensis]|nr:hypothetical protein [Fangia hongkongensis]
MISLTDASQRIENYLYDSNGNLLGAVYSGNVVLRFSYNALNKLSRYSDLINGHQYQYVYTGNGQRAQKSKPAGTDSVYFYYDQKGQLLNERFFAVPSQSYWSEYFFKERTIQEDSFPIESIVEFPLLIRKNSAATVITSKGLSDEIGRFLDDYGMQSNEKSCLIKYCLPGESIYGLIQLIEMIRSL